MRVFDYLNYKEFVRERVASMPSRGRGQLKKIAEHLRVHPTLISQILNTEKDLSLEQGISLCDYLGLSDLERDYFIALMQLEKSGTKSLREYFLTKVQELKKRATQGVSRSQQAKEIREEDKAIFYSQWYHSAIRLLTSIDEYRTLDTLSETLNLPNAKVRTALDFLLSVGLVTEKNGEYFVGPARTFVPSNSPHASRHHVNWRLKAFEAYSRQGETDLAFTLPMTLSKKDAVRLRKMIIEFIESVNPLLDQTEPEELRCLSIDFFSPLGSN